MSWVLNSSIAEGKRHQLVMVLMTMIVSSMFLFLSVVIGIIVDVSNITTITIVINITFDNSILSTAALAIATATFI